MKVFMKTITEFKLKEEYGKKIHYVKVMYLSESNKYLLVYKFVSMLKEDIDIYDNKEIAMYEYTKKVMFLLS